MDRRRFLVGLLAAAAGGTVGCTSGDEGGEQSSPTTGGGSSTTVPLVPEELPPSGLATSPFTLGVASGDPLPGSVILWTRLALDPLAADGAGGMPAEDLTVRWEVSADYTFATLVAAGDATAGPALGHSVHVDVGGLEPATGYHYRFRIGEHTSPAGRTRTAPAEGGEVAELRMAVASCQDFQVGHYAAHASIAADDLDLVLFLGDYIYEYAGDPASLRPVPGGRCTTLADYRIRYAVYKGDPNLQAAHAACPWVLTWDDHEVENNYAGLASQLGTPEADFAAQRAAAYQAYYEHQPLRLDPPAGPDWPIHRTVRWGALAELFVLDGRQHRDDQPCGSPNDAFVSRSACDPAAEDRQMLGADQEGWLLEGLSAATSTWRVLAQQTVMSTLVLGDIVLNVDQWDGYPQARRRLLDHLAAEALPDVVVLTGDIHTAGAGVLRTDGASGPAMPVAVEFVCTSISSSGLAEQVNVDPAILDPSIFGLAYAEFLHRGYCRCTVTPERWTTEYLVVEDVANAASAVTLDATLVTERGRPEITVS